MNGKCLFCGSYISFGVNDTEIPSQDIIDLMEKAVSFQMQFEQGKVEKNIKRSLLSGMGQHIPLCALMPAD